MADIIQIRRDTAANWTAANPVLAQGEFGVETDTLKLKIGDGASPWTGLRYYHSGSPYEAGEGISINDFTINNTGIITIGTGGTNGTIKANGQDIAVKGLGSAAYVDTTILPNKDLSNLTTKGANIGNWSSNVTNCITEIPQDIKLELSSGTLKLKAGSKVYVPNGSGVFDTVTTASDLTTTTAGSGSTDMFYFYSNGSLMARPISDCYSGTSQPTVSTTTAEWYDTTNNVIKHTANTGSTWTMPGTSFPLCICSRSAGAITGIKQVFNGFGYIGSTIFALPNIKGLVPDGRNADGTLKSVAFTTSSVKTQTLTTSTFDNRKIVLKANSFGFSASASYDEKTNTVSTGRDAIVGNGSASSGRITSLYTKQAFHAVDYSDSEYIANLAMPSGRYVDLTLGASGATYTAPADGYIVLSKIASSAGQHIAISNGSVGKIRIYSSGSSQELQATLPVAKGNVVALVYTADGNTQNFRFVYANGAK